MRANKQVKVNHQVPRYKGAVSFNSDQHLKVAEWSRGETSWGERVNFLTTFLVNRWSVLMLVAVLDRFILNNINRSMVLIPVFWLFIFHDTHQKPCKHVYLSQLNSDIEVCMLTVYQQHCAFNLNFLQPDVEELGNCIPGYFPVVSTCMEVVGENQREACKEIRVMQSLYWLLSIEKKHVIGNWENAYKILRTLDTNKMNYWKWKKTLSPNLPTTEQGPMTIQKKNWHFSKGTLINDDLIDILMNFFYFSSHLMNL